MKLRKTTKLIGVSMLALGGLTGCPDPEPEPQEPISHAEVQTQLQDNLKGALGRLDQDLAFVETSALGDAAAGLAAEECEPGEGVEPEMGCAEPEPFDLGMAELADEMVAIIEEALTEDAIESATDDRIIYKLAPSVLCKEDSEVSEGEEIVPNPVADAPEGDDGAPDAPEGEAPGEEIDEAEAGESCEEMVERLEPRVAVSSGAADALRLQLMVGAEQISPVTLEIGPSGLSAALDLAQAKDAAAAIANTLGEELSLPPTFEGAIAVALNTSVANAPSVALSITEAIHIADPDAQHPLSIQIEAAAPAAALTIDAAKKQLEALVDMGAINVDLTIVPEDEEPELALPDEDLPEGEEGEVFEDEMEPIRIALALAGVDFDGTFDIEGERLDVRRIGLGDVTSTLSIDGENQFAVDVNPNDGRATGFSVVPSEEAEGALITLTEAVAELRIETQFAAPDERPEDWADWMEKEVITARLAGDGASLSMGENGMAVVAGQLTLDAQYGGISHEIEAGQCIGFPEEASESEPENGGEDFGADDAVDEAPEATSSHPLASLEINRCG